MRPVPSDAPPPRNAALVGAAAFTLIALPFLFFGPWLLNGKGLVQLQCASGGPCELTRSGYLTTEEVTRFTVAELKGAHVERGRSSRSAGNSIFRANVDTSAGSFPLAYQWAVDSDEAPQQDVSRVLAFQRDPRQGLSLRHDDREPFARVGGAFTGVGVVSLVGAIYLLVRGLRARRVQSP
ncbi:hypothetical protein FGE12_23905 [Aggregicoccus sp. 17bor-14]|uniref:hypothetical protein n=1 Tax=Myxococcaceae TaxID=31 RepID=UPI00129C63EA|nr:MULTISPECIES: hypothetical protein [Myxococcaceae]MBF5045473.1 hypothetical protein [Simulacricoccus sp. 17bor-14]MRI91211.1 hypothetical protein [Aggregicoccus sp. 17bor-14]